jgi:hypothetical protein
MSTFCAILRQEEKMAGTIVFGVLAAALGVWAAVLCFRLADVRREREVLAGNLGEIRESFKIALASIAEWDSGSGVWATQGLSRNDPCVDEIRIGSGGSEALRRVICVDWRGGILNSISVSDGNGSQGQQLSGVRVSSLPLVMQLIFRDTRAPRERMGR